MTRIAILIALALALTLIVVGVRLVLAYRAATGTRWQRFLLVFRNSETILWARIQMLGGLLLTAVSGLVDFTQIPAVDQAVHVVVTDARELAVYGLGMLGLGFVTERVRLHGATADPATGAITTPPGVPVPAPVVAAVSTPASQS